MESIHLEEKVLKKHREILMVSPRLDLVPEKHRQDQEVVIASVVMTLPMVL